MKAKCPNCSWSRDVPDKARGRKGKCPECGEHFAITDEPVPKRREPSTNSGNWEEPQVIKKEEIPCPYCAEPIKKEAKKCRYCGEWLGETDQSGTEKGLQKVPSPKNEKPVRSVFSKSKTPGHSREAPTINVNVPKRSSSLGIVAFIIGALAARPKTLASWLNS